MCCQALPCTALTNTRHHHLNAVRKFGALAFRFMDDTRAVTGLHAAQGVDEASSCVLDERGQPGHLVHPPGAILKRQLRVALRCTSLKGDGALELQTHCGEEIGLQMFIVSRRRCRPKRSCPACTR
jgi:hypothetical protein